MTLLQKELRLEYLKASNDFKKSPTSERECYMHFIAERLDKLVGNKREDEEEQE